MNIEIKESGGKLTVALFGELDHHAAKSLTERLWSALDTHLPESCELDLEGLTFMDSSGIAVVLGLYKRMQEIDGTLVVKNTPKAPMKVLQAAGVNGIVTFE